MNEQLLAAIEHDEHREARLGHQRTAYELGLLRTEFMKMWSDHNVEPVIYLQRVKHTQPTQWADTLLGFADDLESRKTWLMQYANHFYPSKEVAVVRVNELQDREAQLQQYAMIAGGIGGAMATVGFILAFVISFFAIFLLPGLALAGAGIGFAAHLNGRRRTQELVPVQQAQLEVATDPWEQARRNAPHAFDRPHQLQVAATQYAVMVDTIDDQTRVMLVQYRPTVKGYTHKVIQNRRFAHDQLHEATMCKSLLERRAARYEAEARERSEQIMDVVTTRQIERSNDEQSREIARTEAARLAEVLGGQGTTVAPKRLR